MATTNDEIAERVKALLLQHGLEQKALAQRIGIDPSGLSRALSGERAFKAMEIALIAECFGVATSAILEGPPAITPSAVRVAARRSVHDVEAVQAALKRADFFVELAALAGSRSTMTCRALVNSDEQRAWAQGEAAAATLLARTGLGEEPLPPGMHDLARLIEREVGIQVALEPLGSGLDGLSVDCDRFQMAMVSTSTAPARQRWTLAHEVGHLVMGDTDDVAVDRNVWEGKSPRESRANAFAAAFLMPRDLLKRFWGKEKITEEKVANALDVFQVSLDGLAYRLHNCRIASARERDLVRSMRPFISVLRNQATRQSEGTWLPTQLTLDTVKAYGKGEVGVRWLAELVQIDPEEFLDRVGPRSEEVEVFEAGQESAGMRQ